MAQRSSAEMVVLLGEMTAEGDAAAVAELLIEGEAPPITLSMPEPPPADSSGRNRAGARPDAGDQDGDTVKKTHDS